MRVGSEKVVYLQPIKKKKRNFLNIYRGVEQLVAHRAHNPEVISSSLVPATTETVREI